MKSVRVRRWLAVSLARFVFTILSTNTRAAVDSWTFALGGHWQLSNDWSLARPPNLTDSAVWITNSISKNITIDASTSGGFGFSMTVSNIDVGGFGTTTNGLHLINAGTAVPLRVVNVVAINKAGTLLVTNSVLIVEGLLSPNFRIDGSVLLQVGGSVVVTNNTGQTYIGFTSTAGGTLTVNGGSLLTRVIWMGSFSDARNTFNLTAGNVTLLDSLQVGFFNPNATGVVSVTGGELVVTNGAIYVGGEGTGEMTVSGGRALADGVYMLAQERGTLTVSGGILACRNLAVGSESDTGAVWLTGGVLVVTNKPGDIVGGSGFIVDGPAQMGNGSINVSNGTAIVGNNGSGTLNVAGGTLFAGNLIIGENAGAVGTLTMTSGVVTAGLTVGDLAGSTGVVWVRGGQLTMIGAARIAAIGSGQLVVSNGTMNATDMRVGRFGGSNGTLTLAGGTSQFTSQLILGDASSVATGTLWVTGGTVTNALLVIGSNGVGTATVSNGNFRAGNVVLAANPGAQGTLTVAGGTATVSNTLTVGNFACSAIGTVVVSGGRLSVTNAAHNAVLDVRNGTLVLNSGTLTVDKFVITNACGHFTRTGGTLSITTTNLSPNLDADGDGLPNGYEQSHGLDPLNAADANLDNDGDGFTNLQEFQAGTDPQDSNSTPFRITAIARTNNDIRITWSTVPGTTNSLQRTAGSDGSYSTNNFATIFTVTNTAGSTTNYLDIGAATNFPSRFYRVRLVP